LLIEVQTWQLKRWCLLGHQQQRIDHRVAGDAHLTHHARGAAVSRRNLRGREVQLGQLGDQAPVRLLRIGIQDVVGAQTCLHMAHRHLGIEGGQS